MQLSKLEKTQLPVKFMMSQIFCKENDSNMQHHRSTLTQQVFLHLALYPSFVLMNMQFTKLQSQNAVLFLKAAKLSIKLYFILSLFIYHMSDMGYFKFLRIMLNGYSLLLSLNISSG